MLYFDDITSIFIFAIVVELLIAIILILFISIIKIDLKIDEVHYKGIENNIEDDKKVDNKIKENKMKPITSLKSNEIFVFGSNLAGIHGAGAAKTAYREFGAELHVGEGLTGRCYAIPTKDEKLRVRPIEDVGHSILKFINTARRRPDLTFLVTPIGCGLAGFTVEQIAPWFNEARALNNIVLPPEFLNYLNLHVTTPCPVQNLI